MSFIQAWISQAIVQKQRERNSRAKKQEGGEFLSRCWEENKNVRKKWKGREERKSE